MVVLLFIKMKKAQIQMTENIAIMIVVVFLLVFGIIFYSRVREANIKKQIDEYSELDLVKAAQTVTNLPEISCSVNSLSVVGCLDMLKLEAFVALNLTNSSNYYEYYRDKFGKSKVFINSTFTNSSFNCTLYDNPYEDLYNENPVFIPINIYDPIEGYFNFGYIEIVKYTRVIE